jgi:hypothetical protein
MKGMSRVVITSIVREERLIQHIDSKHTYCRYEHRKTITTTVTKEEKPKVIRRKKTTA